MDEEKSNVTSKTSFRFAKDILLNTFEISQDFVPSTRETKDPFPPFPALFVSTV